MNRNESTEETKSCDSLSSSSSIAPQDFNINNQMICDEIEDNSALIQKKIINNNNNNKKWLLRCPVCYCDKSTFFCSDCIKNGDFNYSKERIPQRFAEKKLKYFELKEQQIIISDKIERQLEHKVLKDELVFNLYLF